MLQLLAPVLGTLIDRLVPDKAEAERAKSEMEMSLVEAANQVNIEQIRTNQMEAQHRSLFVAGWRPFIGWTCGVGFAWAFIGNSIVRTVFAANGLDQSLLPTIDTAPLVEMTFAMLGLAGMRSWEKSRGLTK
jgi:hypothetical protein